MALGTESLDALGARVESLLDLQPPQGLVAKLRALGRLRELASFTPKDGEGGPVPGGLARRSRTSTCCPS